MQRDRPGAADRFTDKLLDSIEAFKANPQRGARPRDERLRQLGHRVLVHGEYVVFYKVLPKQVRVYRVLHGRRRYSDLV